MAAFAEFGDFYIGKNMNIRNRLAASKTKSEDCKLRPIAVLKPDEGFWRGDKVCQDSHRRAVVPQWRVYEAEAAKV